MKKLTALILALMMMALPVLGLAASPFEMMAEAVNQGLPLRVDVELIPGEIPAEGDIATMIADVLDALDFTYMQQSGETEQADFILALSGTPVLNISSAVQDGVSYIASNLLGENVVAVTEEEEIPLAERLINMMVEADLMTRSDAEAILAQLPEIAAQEKAAAEINLEDIDMAALGDVAFSFGDKVNVEEVTMQPRNCDPAAQKITFSMTGEDVIAVYDEVFALLENNEAFMAGMASGVASAGGEVTAEETMQAIKDLVAQAAGMLAEPAQVEAYLNEEGDIVAMNMAMLMAVPEEDNETENISVDIAYSRLTVNDGLTHTATAIAKDDENDGVSMTVNVLQSMARSLITFDAAEIENDVTEEAVLGFTAELNKNRTEDAAKDEALITAYLVDEDSNERMSFSIKAEMQADQADGTPAFAMTADLYIMDSEKPLVTLDVKAATNETASSIVTEEAVHPGAMDDQTFNAYTQEVVGAMQTSLIILIQNLPQSVLSLLLGSM